MFLVPQVACEAPVEDDAVELPPAELFRVAPSSGCDDALPNPSPGTFAVTVGGVSRNFRVSAPPGVNTPMPIVYSFHACGGNETAAEWNSLWSVSNQAQWLAPGIDPFNVIVVHGDALGSCWDIAPSGPDLPYYDAVRSAVESSWCVDDDRRYHAGVSSGGFAAQGFACRRDGVAAVWAGLSGLHHAPNPYGLTVHALPEVGECNGPVPVMAMASSTDTLVSPTTYTRPARDRWLQINGCDAGSGVPYVHRVPRADPAAGGAPNGNACTGHGGCSCTEYTCTGARTVWCEYAGTGGNGHQWPLYPRDAAINWFGRFLAPVPDDEGESSSTTSDGGEESSSSSTGCECVCE